MVFTARYAARRLGVDVEVVEELALQMEPEDGCVSVIDSLEETAESVTAFTRQGLDCLDELSRRSSLRLHERRLTQSRPPPDGYKRGRSPAASEVGRSRDYPATGWGYSGVEVGGMF